VWGRLGLQVDLQKAGTGSLYTSAHARVGPRPFNLRQLHALYSVLTVQRSSRILVPPLVFVLTCRAVLCCRWFPHCAPAALQLLGASKGDELWSAGLEQASHATRRLLLTDAASGTMSLAAYTPG
jgi:hypothetical protein